MQTSITPPDPPPKSGVPADWEHWPELDEAGRMSDQMGCLEDVLATMRRLRALVISSSALTPDERTNLLKQMRHVLRHLHGPLQAMQAEIKLRKN
jgi:hypothetical protein